MNLSEIITKIRNHYLDYLNETEMEVLASGDEKKIRVIVNKIWHQFLTWPDDYVVGEPFNFLAKRDIFYNFDYVSLADYHDNWFHQ